PGLERDDLPAGAREPLQQRGTARAAAHDREVDLLLVVEAPPPLPQRLVRAAPVERQQPRGLVAGAYASHRHSSRRSTAASRPMPPTNVTSSGATIGGPISRLYRVLRQPPGRCATPRACRNSPCRPFAMMSADTTGSVVLATRL